MSQPSGSTVKRAASESATDGQTSDANEGPLQAARIDNEPLAPGFILEEESVSSLVQRVAQLERRSRIQIIVIASIVVIVAGVFLKSFLVDSVIVRQKLMESKELTLLDNDGNARLFLRMFSKVPVLQIMDSNGRPRMSLGLRFDDSPFVDLSDKTGRTRATFEMTEDDTPALRMFDANGTPTFNIN